MPQLPHLPPLGVHGVLEAVHGDLPENGGDAVLDPPGQEVEPAARVVFRREQPLEGQRLPEYRRRLGGRERRGGVVEAERLGEYAVQPVAELVREREDGAAVARVVHEHVRVNAGDRGGAEGAGALVLAHGCVDPAVGEEPLDGGARFPGEVGIGADDELPRVGPRRLARVVGDRREAVVVHELLQPEELRLQPVVALRHVVPRHGGVDQRLHRLVGGLVAEVAGRDPGRIPAQAVVDRLVREDRVERERPRAQTGLERGGDGLGGAAAQVPVRVVELRHRRLERELVAVERHPKRSDQLLVQARPRGDARDALLGDDALLGLREQVGPVLADRPQPVGPPLELGGGEQRLGVVVVELGQLEGEEQELGAERRLLLGQLRDEGAARRIRHIGGEVEVRVVGGAVEDLVYPLALGDRVAERCGVQLGDLAAIPVAEGGGALLRLPQVTLERGIVGTCIEIGQVPRDLLRPGHLDRRHVAAAYRSAGSVTGDWQAKRSQT